MQTEIVAISVNWITILRCLGALIFGIIYSLCLEFTEKGQFIAEKRTWLSVVIGVGVDLLIGFRADYAAICLVIAFSSVGIIARSLINESRAPEVPTGYAVLHHLEDAARSLSKLRQELEASLTKANAGEMIVSISRSLALAYMAAEHISAVRNSGVICKSRTERLKSSLPSLRGEGRNE